MKDNNATVIVSKSTPIEKSSSTFFYDLIANLINNKQHRPKSKRARFDFAMEHFNSFVHFESQLYSGKCNSQNGFTLSFFSITTLIWIFPIISKNMWNIERNPNMKMCRVVFSVQSLWFQDGHYFWDT